MNVTTKEQRKALKDLWIRSPYNNKPYRAFRKTAWFSFETLMVPFCGMLVGIEPDGYTHS